jgi:cytidylate kinase
VLIIISGPIASGKSSVALGVARELQRDDVATAVVDLDQLYEMQTHALDEPEADAARWRAARHAAAALAESFTADGIAAVIVEGSFQTQPDRLAFTASLRSRSDALFVTLRVSYKEALRPPGLTRPGACRVIRRFCVATTTRRHPRSQRPLTATS